MTVRDSGLVASGRRGVAATARLSAARRWFLAAFAIGIGLTSPGQAAAQPARQAIAGTDVAMTVFDPGVNGSMGIIAWIDNSRLAFMVAPPNPRAVQRSIVEHRGESKISHAEGKRSVASR